MFRYISFLILAVCSCLSSYAQAEGWQVYSAYSAPVQVKAAGYNIYAITKGNGTYASTSGNLVRYDASDGSIKTYDCLHDLNDKEIVHISYNEATQRLLIVYTTGNIDLLDADDEVWNISALMESTIPGTNVNGIAHVGSMAYLCSENGIVEIDCSEAVVRETYRSLDARAYSMLELGGQFYVSTSKGLFCFPATSNMHDRNLWTTPKDGGEYLELATFDGHIFGRRAKGIVEIRLDGTAVDFFPSVITFLDASKERLVIGTTAFVYIWENVFESPWRSINFAHGKNIHDVAFLDGRYYIAEGIDGLNSYELQDASFVDQDRVFDINSPRRDLFYHMHYEGERLLVAGGINTQMAAYYPATFMYMEDDGGTDRWTLFDEKAIAENYPRLSNYNAVDLVQDPTDANHFFGAAYRNGLHEYRRSEGDEVQLVKVYNYENSPLRCIDNGSAQPWNYCTCTALQYDQHGNLWMANQQTDTIVRLLRPNGKWMSLFYPEIANTTNVYQYLFSSHDINFLVCYEGSTLGFFGFDTSGTLNVVDDDRHLLRSSITNQDGTTVYPTQFYCMTEDRDHQIWCGTNEGLFVMTSPQEWFDSDFTFHQIKRNRNDGSGYADYLLSGVDITCIAVDPSNRKWVGTQRNGVYLFSHDGQETVHHFTTENSPLLSNRIHSIAIHPQDGRVMFGTDAGLCSYDAAVTPPAATLKEDNILVYPNPVRPGTSGVVTIQGLTDGAEVKILSASSRVVWGAKSIGGTVRWNCSNMRGEPVPSGVYHVVCNTADAGTIVVSRVVVIR